MKAYLDSGVFIDYLVGRGHTGAYLRSTERRGRKPAQLGKDAEACLKKLSSGHSAITSSLTCYEVEEALYRELKRSATEIDHADRFIIPAARAVITQALVTIELFGIEMVDLTPAIVKAQCQNLELQTRGIRAADALHVTTAMLLGADILMTSDEDLLHLDNIFTNRAGTVLRCVETHTAIGLLI